MGVISVLSRASHANNAAARRQLGRDRTGGMRGPGPVASKIRCK